MLPRMSDAMTETELRAKVEAMCAERGLLYFHVPDSRGMTPGLPDCMIIGRRVLFRELKNDYSTRSPDQTQVGYALLSAGADAATWRPRDWLAGTIGAQLDEICW